MVNVPVFARLLRGSMLAQRDERLRAGGHARSACAAATVVLRHVLPNSISPVIVQGTLTLATAIIDAAGLAFLGLSAAPTRRSRSGAGCSPRRSASSPAAPHLAFFPGLAIVVAALGFTLLGESLREALDPKYRR